MEDIYAYADDVLILCDDLKTLRKCLQLIESWSEENNLKINRNKSAIMEFIHKKERVTTLKIGDTFMEYPIVNQYKYLGTWFNQKLTLDTQIQHILEKTYFIRSRLSPTLYTASLDFRKNLWQIFVIPMYEFMLPLCYHEESSTKKELVQRMLRKSFKSYTSIKKTVRTDLIHDLMGYDISERSKHLHYISEQKWKYRELGKAYKQSEDKNLTLSKEAQSKNMCKYLPKSAIRYINMQTCLCPSCKVKGVIARCTKEHLQNNHQIDIDTIYTLVEQVQNLKNDLTTTTKKGEAKGKIERRSLLEHAEKIFQPNIEKIKGFLNRI